MNKNNYISKLIIGAFRTWYIIGGVALFIAILEEPSLKAILGLLALVIIVIIIELSRGQKNVKNSSFGFNVLFIGWFLMMFLMSLNNNWWFYNHIQRESTRFAKQYSKFVINNYQKHLNDGKNENLDNQIEYSRKKLKTTLNKLHITNPTNDSIPYYISKIEIKFPETYIEGDVGWGILGPATTQKYREAIELGSEYFTNSKTEVNIYDIAKKINPKNADKKIIQDFQKNYMNMKGDYIFPRDSLVFLSKSNDVTFQRKITILPGNETYTTNQTSENLKLSVFKKSLTNLVFSFYKTWDLRSKENQEYIATYTLHGSVPLIFYGLICLLIPFIIVLLDKRHKDNTNQLEEEYLDIITNLKKEDIPDELWDLISGLQVQYPSILDENSVLKTNFGALKAKYENFKKKYEALEKKYDEDINLKLTNAAKKENQETEDKATSNNIIGIDEIDDSDFKKAIKNKSYIGRLQKNLLQDVKNHEQPNISKGEFVHHGKQYASKLYKKLNKNSIVKEYITKVKSGKNKTTSINRLELIKNRKGTKPYELVIISARNDSGYSVKASLTAESFYEAICLALFIQITMFKDYKLIDKVYKD